LDRRVEYVLDQGSALKHVSRSPHTPSQRTRTLGRESQGYTTVKTTLGGRRVHPAKNTGGAAKNLSIIHELDIATGSAKAGATNTFWIDRRPVRDIVYTANSGGIQRPTMYLYWPGVLEGLTVEMMVEIKT